MHNGRKCTYPALGGYALSLDKNKYLSASSSLTRRLADYDHDDDGCDDSCIIVTNVE